MVVSGPPACTAITILIALQVGLVFVVVVLILVLIAAGITRRVVGTKLLVLGVVSVLGLLLLPAVVRH